jgi:hypothetical protein
LADRRAILVNQLNSLLGELSPLQSFNPLFESERIVGARVSHPDQNFSVQHIGQK